MPTDIPLACSLAPAEMSSRLREIRAIGQAAFVSVQATELATVLRFRMGADTRDRLQDIVAAESECCPFLELDLTDQGEALVLTVRAPEGGEPVVHELVAALRGEGPVAR